MGKLVELVLAAIFGAVVAVVGAAFTFGAWKTTIEQKFESLDILIAELSGRTTKLETLRENLAGLPAGSVLAWDPVIRDSAGNESGRQEIPKGWEICGTSARTKELAGAVLVGSQSISQAAETGGQSKIGVGVHAHEGFALTKEGRSQGVVCSGSCNGPISSHSHDLWIEKGGSHQHGTNYPPFYSVIFLCKKNASS